MSTIAPGELTVRVTTDATGRTRLATLRQRYPQRVTTALHTDPAHPHAAVLCVQSPSGGTFSDDALRTTVHCTPGTHLQLTSQAATQVFAGDGPGSRHHLSFTVEAGAALEYLPKTVIPQASSRFTQTLELDVADGGLYIGWDAVAAGRIAHGERFRYASVDNAFTVRSEGRVLARDRQVITPQAVGMLDGDYLATLLVVMPGQSPQATLTCVRAALDDLSGVGGGAGELPSHRGVFVRLTADRAPALRDAQRRLHTAARTAMTQRLRRSA